jgi:hypothetical protein
VRHLPATRIAALVLVLLLAGCASDPSVQWYRQAAAVRAVQETVIDGFEAKAISDETLVRIDSILRMAEDLLFEAEAALDTDPNISESKLVRLAELLARVARLYYAETGREVDNNGG